MVRPGVALYGANPRRMGARPGAPNLMQTAAVLTGRVLQLRRIDSAECRWLRSHVPRQKAHHACHRGARICRRHPARTASNKGHAAIRGLRAPFAGRVSMDTVILDVTDMAQPPAVPATKSSCWARP